MISLFITILLTYPFLHQIISFYHLSDEASALTYHIIATTLFIFPLTWPSSFTIPNFIRAAGDAKYTMFVSVGSMLIVRVGGAYLLSSVFHLGLMGVWLGMYSDWICRTIFFVTRLRGNKWLEKRVI
jgi:Na+-driven multidrug efflux pump